MSEVGTQAKRVRKDTRKRKDDRHKPGYQREWMRRKRAKVKASKAASNPIRNHIITGDLS